MIFIRSPQKAPGQLVGSLEKDQGFSSGATTPWMVGYTWSTISASADMLTLVLAFTTALPLTSVLAVLLKLARAKDPPTLVVCPAELPAADDPGVSEAVLLMVTLPVIGVALPETTVPAVTVPVTFVLAVLELLASAIAPATPSVVALLCAVGWFG